MSRCRRSILLSLLFLAALRCGARAGDLRLSSPGGWTYAEDTAYEPTVVEHPHAWRSVASFLAESPRWSFPLTSSGALLFEGIPCPYPEMAPHLTTGALGALELLPFPAGGWWGPSSGEGGVQFVPSRPAAVDRPWSATSWLSPKDMGVGVGRTGPEFAFRLASDRRHVTTDDWENDLSFTASGTRKVGEPFALDGSLLHVGSSDAQWDVARGSIVWDNGNFQRVGLSPYVQRALWGGDSSREGGVECDHHLDLAGLLETLWGVGGSARDGRFGGDRFSLRQGHLRLGVFIDALGMAQLDAMGRWDAVSGRHPAPSVMAGLKVPRGIFTFEAALHRSARPGDIPGHPLGDGETAEGSVGLRVRPLETAFLQLRFLHRKDEPSRWRAWEPRAEWTWKRPLFRWFEGLKFEGIGLAPFHTEGWGVPLRSLVGGVRLTMRGGWSLGSSMRWVERGRGAVRADLQVPYKTSLFILEGENLSGGDGTWPEMDLEPGRRFRVAWEGSF